MIKLAASNFARWFVGALGKESPILGTLLPQKPKIGQIGARRQVLPIDASPLRLRFTPSPLGMCAYTAVPEDGRTCSIYATNY